MAIRRVFVRPQAWKIPAVAKRGQEGLSIDHSLPPTITSTSNPSRWMRKVVRHFSLDQLNRGLNPRANAGATWTMDAILEASLPCTSELFNFTKGRFVADEQHELAKRHRKFDVCELARCAAQAVQADHCLSITKYPDGMYNRVLLLCMDNGKEVIAKIPNPNSGQPHCTTTSEVATMKFAREVLGTPLPQVYAWSSRAQETLVGAEFILMEKMKGVELEQFWPKMKLADRLEVVKTVAGYQTSWASITFEQFGSLYFPEDIYGPRSSILTYTNHEGQKVNDPRFVIGPSTGREWFDDGRADIEFDRGPWGELQDYHIAIGKREIASVKDISHLPDSPVSLHGSGLYQPTRQKKLEALETYLKLLEHLLPADSCLGSGHLWHGDLHAGNIFVNPANPTQVVGLIDWQSTELAPLYFQARQPHFIDYEGPPVHGLERPVLPPDFDKLGPSEQRPAQALFFQQSLCALYLKIMYHECPKVFECYEFQESPAFALLLLARNILIDGEATYMGQACELRNIWETLSGARGIAFPLTFSAAETQAIEADVEHAALGMEAKRTLREALGDLSAEQGYVSHEKHEEAVGAFSHTRDEVLAEYAQNAVQAS